MVDKLVFQFKQTKLAQELNQQPRLQWLILFIFVILLVSVSKSGFDAVALYRENMENEINLYNRLNALKNAEFSSTELDEAAQQSEKLSDAIPIASSQNAAQASALSEIEQELRSLAERERYKLLGSEVITIGGKQFWSIRIEIVGQLKPNNTLALMQAFDPKVLHRRVSSFRYSPKANNSLSLVVDLLYKQDATR